MRVLKQHFRKYPGIIRFIDVGGLSKLDLLEELQRNGVSLNPLAEQLFESSHFITSKARFRVATIEITVHDLGFHHGATISAIYSKAESMGLLPCPLELAPYFRLQYLDQADSQGPLKQGKAPAGSITIASIRHTEDDDIPQGFYLRRIKDHLWLRGYCCSADYEWKADDHFLFIVAEDPGSGD